MSNDDCNPNDRSRSWVIRLLNKFMKINCQWKKRRKSAIVLAEKTLTFKDDKIKTMRIQILVDGRYNIVLKFDFYFY